MNDITTAAAVEIESGKAAPELLRGVLPKFPDLKALIPDHGGSMPLWIGEDLLAFWSGPCIVKTK